MQRKLTPAFGLIVALCLIPIPVNGLVRHQVTVRGSEVLLNSTLLLEEDKPINYWQLSWRLPPKAQLISIKDSHGAIEDYQLEQGNLTLETNRGPRRRQEKVSITARLPATSSYYGSLARFELTLPAFTGEETYIRLKAPHLLSWSTPLGFESSLSSKGENNVSVLKLAGKGPTSFSGYYLDFGVVDSNVVASKHFVSVQGYNFSAADPYYRWLAGIAGFYPPYDQFPVLVLPQEEYQARVNSWSLGTYQQGGLILLKNETLQQRGNLSILLHEAMHGFNAKALRWDGTDITWFDEGVAKFIEFLVNSDRGLPQAEIFGYEYYFDRHGGSYYLEPRQRPEDLWRYYQENRTFMRYWSPKQGNREFGYAFAELFIRNYIKQEGFERLRQAYTRFLAQERPINNSETRTNLILETLGRELAPCRRSTRSQLEQCLSQLRNYTYHVPLAGIDKARQEVEIPEFDYQPEKKQTDAGSVVNDSQLFEQDSKRETADQREAQPQSIANDLWQQGVRWFRLLSQRLKRLF